MTCKLCREPFVLQPDKSGYANVCPACTLEHPPKEPERLMATVAWSGKHTPEITVTTAAKARAFNRLSRWGVSPDLRFTPASGNFAGRTPLDVRDGSVIGMEYRTRTLREGRKVR
jgi:hypothetical protein